jgi:hypothetical protein
LLPPPKDTIILTLGFIHQQRTSKARHVRNVRQIENNVT